MRKEPRTLAGIYLDIYKHQKANVPFGICVILSLAAVVLFFPCLFVLELFIPPKKDLGSQSNKRTVISSGNNGKATKHTDCVGTFV